MPLSLSDEMELLEGTQHKCEYLIKKFKDKQMDIDKYQDRFIDGLNETREHRDRMINASTEEERRKTEHSLINTGAATSPNTAKVEYGVLDYYQDLHDTAVLLIASGCLGMAGSPPRGTY